MESSSAVATPSTTVKLPEKSPPVIETLVHVVSEANAHHTTRKQARHRNGNRQTQRDKTKQGGKKHQQGKTRLECDRPHKTWSRESFVVVAHQPGRGESKSLDRPGEFCQPLELNTAVQQQCEHSDSRSNNMILVVTLHRVGGSTTLSPVAL